MASKILLIISFVAIANGNVYEQAQAHHAQVAAQIQAQAQAMARAHSNAMAHAFAQTDENEDDNNEEPAPHGFRKMYVPPLPPPPPLYVPDFSQDFHHFAHHQPLNFAHVVHIPSPGEIKNIKPAPGQVFNGVCVKSSSGFGKDKEGKTIRTGGTTVVINDNGEVKETKVGKNPPNIDDPIVFPSTHEFVMPKMPDPVIFKPIVFKPMKPITFKPIVFEPITFKPIDMNYVPAEGENFVAVSSSSHSETSNINGLQSSSGGSSDMVNINGAVDQAAVEFHGGDDPDKQIIAEDE